MPIEGRKRRLKSELSSNFHSNPMRAFRVYLNGKKLCVAGVGDDGVLSAIVDCVGRSGGTDTSLHIGGLLNI